MNRKLNFLLVVLAVIGAGLWLWRYQEFRKVDTERKRLANLFGELEIGRGRQIVFKRAESGDPYDFLWRIYQPANVPLKRRVEVMGGTTYGGSTTPRAREQLMRLRFVVDQDRASIHFIYPGGSSTQSFGTKKSALFLLEHWDEFEFESPAVGENVSVETDEATTLLISRIPKHLRQKALKEFSSAFQKVDQSGEWLRVKIGTEAAFQKEKKKEQFQK